MLSGSPAVETKLTCYLNEVKKKGPLVTLLHPHYLLCDVLTGRAYTTHSQEDVVVQEVSGQYLWIYQELNKGGKQFCWCKRPVSPWGK